MKVSIITPAYNSAQTIESTLRSIGIQTYPDIEHIIIDGGSTDDTLKLVEKHGDRVSLVVSEPDDGIFDAMNKGIKRATGDIIGILNSDDFYTHSRVIEKLVKKIQETQADTVYADLQYVHPEFDNRVVRYWKSGSYNPKKFLMGWMPPHPTFFVRREVYERFGLFDAGFNISGDYELMLRFLFRFGVSSAYLPEVIVRMRAGGNSNDGLRTRIKANKEDRLAWEMNGLEYKFYTPILKPVRKLHQFRFQIAALLY